jgi:AraC-like DNA-binding protein
MLVQNRARATTGRAGAYCEAAMRDAGPEPRFRTHLVREVLAHVEERGGDPLRLVRELPSGAATQPWVELPLGRLHAFLDRAAEAAADPWLGVHVGARLSRATWDLLQVSCLSSPTLADALLRIERLIPLFNDLVEIEVRRTDGELSFVHRIPGQPDGLSRHGNEALLVAILTRAREATGTPVRPRAAWVAHTREGSGDALREALGCDALAFGAGETGLAFDAATCELPLRSADPVLLAVLDRLSAPMLELVTARRGVASQVLRELERRLHQGAPPISAVARALGTSSRSLQRALAEAGTSYRELVDHARRCRARALLAQGLLPADVALRLGYADLTSFTRAFARWSAEGGADRGAEAPYRA